MCQRDSTTFSEQRRRQQNKAEGYNGRHYGDLNLTLPHDEGVITGRLLINAACHVVQFFPPTRFRSKRNKIVLLNLNLQIILG